MRTVHTALAWTILLSACDGGAGSGTDSGSAGATGLSEIEVLCVERFECGLACAPLLPDGYTTACETEDDEYRSCVLGCYDEMSDPIEVLRTEQYMVLCTYGHGDQCDWTPYEECSQQTAIDVCNGGERPSGQPDDWPNG